MTQVAEKLTVGGSKEHTGRGTAVRSERSESLIGHNVSECYPLAGSRACMRRCWCLVHPVLWSVLCRHQRLLGRNPRVRLWGAAAQ
jgi:hypothetical protein